ncbi:MAG TPA: helix-turn-helix domain-containing protein [Streptosporangiaceae bacterium]|nr:helix-turn-helix domain-containing protein [Streptosporangiaceae bacterium]
MNSANRLLSIGQFARATGLTAKALRHYDAVGLLTPAVVDTGNGYRRYSVDQLATARLIRKLRALELPVAEVRRLLDLHEDEAGALAAELLAHRKRLESRVVRLQRQMHDLDHLVAEKGWHDMGETKDQLVLEPEVQRQIAAACFNRVWTLLEKETRTESEDAQMIHAAHASTYHWMQIGEPVRRARGEWQCSRVYCVLGHPEAAMFHARKVLEICQREGIGDFDLAFAYEGLARASAVAGDTDEARRWAEMARSAATDIAEEFDRELLLGDLDTLPAGV